MNNLIHSLREFLDVQKKAEQAGEKTFTCPLCGGEAWWGRASVNNHLHCGCKACGFSLME